MVPVSARALSWAPLPAKVAAWCVAFLIGVSLPAQGPDRPALPSGALVRVGAPGSRADGAYLSVALSPRGDRLVTGYLSSHFRLWDLATGKESARFPGHKDAVFSVALSPEGRHLASGGHDGTVRLWDLSTRSQVFLKTGHQMDVQSTVWAVAFSPDGRILASGAMDETVRLWEVPTGRELACLRGHGRSVMGLSFSPDGKAIASAGMDMTVRLWDVARGKELRRFAGHAATVRSVSFSPAGNSLASASSDKTIRYWRTDTGKPLGLPVRQPDEVHAVAFSPDGRTLASGGRDGVVRLWETSTHREVLRFEPDGGPVTGLAFAADGRAVASVESKGQAHLWDVTGLRKPVEAGPAVKRKVEELWKGLMGNDPVRAYRAGWLLVAAPGEVVPLVQKHLRPRPVPVEEIKRWITELDDDSFEVRERATEELEKQGHEAGPFLQRALEARPPLEPRRRIEKLLANVAEAPSPQEHVRMGRALAVLERLETRGAREALEKLARSTPGSWLAQEARASLRRLDRRAAPIP